MLLSVNGRPAASLGSTPGVGESVGSPGSPVGSGGVSDGVSVGVSDGGSGVGVLVNWLVLTFGCSGARALGSDSAQPAVKASAPIRIPLDSVLVIFICPPTRGDATQ
jgi:hypothetical protein